MGSKVAEVVHDFDGYALLHGLCGCLGTHCLLATCISDTGSLTASIPTDPSIAMANSALVLVAVVGVVVVGLCGWAYVGGT